MISGSRLKLCTRLLLAVGLCACLHAGAQAAPIPFAAFNDIAPPHGTPTFGYADNTTSGTISAINGGQVNFSWLPNLIAANPTLAAMQPGGSQLATMTILNGTTNQPINNAAGNLQQGFNSPVTIEFTRNTPFNGQSNLLTLTFENTSNAQGLTGTSGATVAALTGDSAAANQTVVFSSDFISFDNSTENAFSWTLLINQLTGLTQATANAFNPFTANLVGLFEAMPLPFVPVPEPTSVVILGLGLASSLGVRRWFRSKRK